MMTLTWRGGGRANSNIQPSFSSLNDDVGKTGLQVKNVEIVVEEAIEAMVEATTEAMEAALEAVAGTCQTTSGTRISGRSTVWPTWTR